MESELLSIGRMARATGLTVSALRFYDGAGILTPILVDPVTGYRWYAHRQVRPGRLIARLRRVEMPLADIAAVLRHWPEPAPVRRLLDAHLRRLRDGLADARRELSRVDALLDSEETTMTDTTSARLTIHRADLTEALKAVRFAVGADPDLPMLHGILLDVDTAVTPTVLRLVATDRYRMAISAATADLAGDPVSVIAPAELMDRVAALLDGHDGAPDERVTLTLGGSGIVAELGDRRVTGTPMDQEFPDYRRLVRLDPTARPRHRATVDVTTLRDALVAAPTREVPRELDAVRCEISVLSVDPDGRLVVTERVSPDAVGVNREFLLEALDATGHDQLTLDLDGPIMPLAVRVPGDERTFSILMPVRLPEHAELG